MKGSEPPSINIPSASGLTPLAEAVRSALALESFPATARQIFRHAKELTGATAGYVALLSRDGQRNEVLFLDAGGTPCTVDPALPMPIQGLRAEAYRIRGPLIENDFTHSRWVSLLPAGHAPLRNVLFAPILIQGAPAGLLGLANKPSDFTGHNKTIVKSLADFAALALLNSRNLDALRELNQTNERSLKLNLATQDFLKLANAHHTLVTLLPAFVQALQRVTHCTSVGIRIVGKGGTIPFIAHTGLPEGFFELENPPSLQADNCLCSLVLRRELGDLEARCTPNGSFVTNTLNRDVEELPNGSTRGLRKTCCQFGFSSLALVPVRSGEDILGTFFAADPYKGKMSTDLVTLMETIGLHLGPAIQRLMVEDHLRERGRELERANVALLQSNKELEQFARAASHDLQEPLRMVSTFLELLVSRNHGKLDEEGIHFIEMAVNGSNRMRQMIGGLLEYAGAQSGDLHVETLDMNEVLGQVLADLDTPIREAGAIITHDTYPCLNGNRSQLALLFHHLLMNAIKFRQANQSPRIHVGSLQDVLPDWHLFVRDDGIGIDPRFFGKLFTIFRRLHGAGQYPGIGIGLAVCKKIVERHGGHIWIESALGIGSTFHFTLANQRLNHHPETG